MSNSGKNSYISDFLKLTYSCRKVLQIFLNFWHDIKKWRFDVHFDVVFFQKSGREDILPTAPFHLVLLWIQTTWWREKSHRAVVRSAVRRQSTFQSVSGCGPRRVRGVTGSQSGPLSLSFLLYSWRRTVLGRFPKPQRSMTHYANTGRGEFTPRESEIKTERTPVLNILPRPRLI
jgi:hypothetical protein